MNERFNRRDLRFLLVCAAIVAVSAVIAVRYFDSAFPEASIDFKYNRDQSRVLAEKFTASHRLAALPGSRHAAQFDHDDSAKIYLERKLGLEKANALMKRDVHVWYWRHRWFKPLQKEELRVDVAPTGEIVAFEHLIPEERAMPAIGRAEAQRMAESFLLGVGVPPERLNLVSVSERKLPQRIETTYTWDARNLRPAGAPYRYEVRFDGSEISAFSQKVKVPDQWLRDYADLRSKNEAAGSVDTVFMLLTMGAALVVFIIRMRRGDVQTRFVLWSAAVGAVLVTLVSLNAFPTALAEYDTKTSYSAFVTRHAIFAVLQGVGVALFLMIIVGAGESLYRGRFGNKLAIPRLLAGRALTSKRVFLSFILGYTLVALFLAYQVLFYLTASRFGAWSPADIPYDDILNTTFPWVAVLFMGFLPAMSEEFMSRAFSIPFLEKILRSPVLAIVISGFIWGFGHAAYPNQPFYIRGIEVGVAGVVIGTLLYRFGLLPLLVWHYTVDALYTSLLLFRSHNAYYIVSGGIASMVFALPVIVSLILYFRNRGFVGDAELNNDAIGSVAPVPVTEAPAREGVAVPASAAVRFPHVAILIGAIAVAAAVTLIPAPSLDDVIDYRIGADQADRIAADHVRGTGIAKLPARHGVLADAGFRVWDPDDRREEGGSPGSFDSAALEYIVTRGRNLATAVETMTRKVEGATYIVRYFTPRQKEEIVVEVDPRTSRATGMHHFVEEDAPGATLEQAAAAAIAVRELPRYGLQPSLFEQKEALSFQQPKRRDWLFHFQELQPITAQAHRRVSVRVSGDRVTQVAKTVWIPEKDRRDLTRQSLVNILLLVAQILGFLGLLTLAVSGYVMSLRGRRFAWRTAAKWTAALAIGPIAAAVLQYRLFVMQYNTSIDWNTFVVLMGVGITVQIAMQLAAVFVAVSAIEGMHPWAFGLLTGDGRRNNGVAGVVAGLTAVGIVMAVAGILRKLPAWIPQWSVVGIDPSQLVVIPAPAVVAIWQSILTMLFGTAAIAAIGFLLGRAEGRRKHLLLTALFVSLAFSSLQSHANGGQIVVVAGRALILAGVVFLLFRFVLRGALLAVPVSIFALQMLRKALDLLQNDRGDLHANGYVVAAVLVVAIVWLVVPGLVHREEKVEVGAAE